MSPVHESVVSHSVGKQVCGNLYHLLVCANDVT